METNEDPGISLLLVDDEIDFLEALAPPLVRRGFCLTLAENGLAALRLLAERRFDAVVLDVRMPGISGVDLFYKIQVLAPDLPVILLTGYPTVQDAVQTAWDGLFEYLTKPCDVDELARVVRAAAARTDRTATDRDASWRAATCGARLLLADADEQYARLLTADLERCSLHVTSATTAREALEHASSEGFDVAVVAANVDEAQDAGLVRSLRQAQPGLAVIVLADHPSAEHAVETLRCGAFAFLSKPQTAHALLQWVADAVICKRSRQAAAAARDAPGQSQG